MKLLINSDIIRSSSNGLGWSDEDIDYEKERIACASKVLGKFCVQHVLTNVDSHWTVLIYTQKVCLDEVNMNTLFANGFSEFDIPLDFTYSALGGEGCDFAMTYTGEIK